MGEYLKTPLETPYTVGGMQTPNQTQTPEKGGNQTPNLCTVEGGYQGTTHIRYVYVFFSVKKNKFIRPIKVIGDRVVGKYMYELYPGQYILIGYDNKSKMQPPRTIIAQLVNIDNDCNVHYGESAIIRFENFEWIEKQDLPAPLRDIINWAPGYHSRPNIDFNKVYDNNDTQRLLEMITKKVRITEGEEHE